jgi:hypothetical protein
MSFENLGKDLEVIYSFGEKISIRLIKYTPPAGSTPTAQA